MIQDLENEIWKDVIGFEDYYQISNAGRVKSKARQWIAAHGSVQKHKEKIMKLVPTGNGYLKVMFCISTKRIFYSVHRLVALHFINNQDVDIKININHKNGIKTDNRIENLEWCTQSENAIHAFENNLRVGMPGEKHPRSVLTEEKVLQARKFYADNKDKMKIPQMADNLGIHRTTFDGIVKNRSWKHVK